MFLNKLRKTVKNIPNEKILINSLLLSCLLYTASTIVSQKYDWDIDQFMYFGSRLANGELAFVREYDDKSVAVHVLFLIPFWLRSIRAWFLISAIAATITGYIFYKILTRYARSEKANAAIAAMYFAFLITSTRGGINHINGIAACMTLACVSGIALCTPNTSDTNVNKITPIYILLGAWSISIRPYYILTTLAAIAWPGLRALVINKPSTNRFQSVKNILNKSMLANAIKNVALLAAFMSAINVLPYIFTGEGKALADAFIINKISITPGIQEGLVNILFIAVAKAPLVILPIIVANIIVIADVLRSAKKKDLNTRKLLERNIDLIYSASIMPMLLAQMISTRHFHNHYLALFAPFSTITLYLLLAKRGNKNSKGTAKSPIKTKNNRSITTKIILGLGLTYHCIYPIVKMTEQFAPWNQVRTKGRENILKELKELVKTGGKSKSFVVTRDNHFHWRLNQSRLGIPHASLLSKIATGYENIDQATNKASQIKTVFKYPDMNQLCNTMLEANPYIYVVPKLSIEDSCLTQENSGYSFYKEVERGHTWNLTNTKIGVIHIRTNQAKNNIGNMLK